MARRGNSKGWKKTAEGCVSGGRGTYRGYVGELALCWTRGCLSQGRRIEPALGHVSSTKFIFSVIFVPYLSRQSLIASLFGKAGLICKTIKGV